MRFNCCKTFKQYLFHLLLLVQGFSTGISFAFRRALVDSACKQNRSPVVTNYNCNFFTIEGNRWSSVSSYYIRDRSRCSLSVNNSDGNSNGDDQEESNEDENWVDDDDDKSNMDLFASIPPPSMSKMKSLQDQIRSQYDDDTLQRLLDTHDMLNSEIEMMKKEGNNDSNTDPSSVLSLHDIIMKTVSDMDADDVQTININDISKYEKDTKNMDLLQKKALSVKAVASDVDGTLLTSNQDVHPRTLAALRRVIEEVAYTSKLQDGDKSNVPLQLKSFFLATGKSREGALRSLGEEIRNLITSNQIPGVYIQGLYCIDGEGNIVFEKKLQNKGIQAVENLALDALVGIVAYDGDNLLTTELTKDVIHLSEYYGEPMPKLLPDNSMLASYSNGLHKILLIDEDVKKIEKLRPALEKVALENDATVTQALPTMLEFLPGGCSKGRGVSAMCSFLGIKPEMQLLALGDAENDAEMLKMAALGIAVGNATPPAKKVADYVMKETNDHGGAGAAIETFIFERTLSS